MKKILFALAIFAAMTIVPMTATADKITGSVQGLVCVTHGKVCPVGKEDPMAAAENVFVVLADMANKEYYFVPNVERTVLARHINEQITVEGKVDEAAKSITASAIYVGDRKIWSTEMQEEMRRMLWP